MINKRSKMQRSNAKIKKYLYENGWKEIHLFPHSRFSLDYHLGPCGFDAFGWKQDIFGKWIMWLFQFKTNMRCPKKEMELYRQIEKEYLCKCAWINAPDRKPIEFFETN